MIFCADNLIKAGFWKLDHWMDQIDITYGSKKFDSRDYVIQYKETKTYKDNKKVTIVRDEAAFGFCTPTKRARCSGSDE